MEILFGDIRHICKSLLKTPMFASSVVLTLALGIGGNTALFSVVDQLLLRPLPYPDGDHLVTVYEKWLSGGPERGSVSPGSTGSVRAARSGNLPRGAPSRSR